MRCEQCKIPMEILSDQRYQYTESGLDNVYLEGISVYVCPYCETKVAQIPKIEQLHDLIGRALAAKPAPLTGAEVRFLRKNLGISARKWAEMIGVDPATLSRWESGGQKCSASLDLLVRLLYLRQREEREGRHYPDKIVPNAQTCMTPGQDKHLAVILHRLSDAYRYESLSA